MTFMQTIFSLSFVPSFLDIFRQPYEHMSSASNMRVKLFALTKLCRWHHNTKETALEAALVYSFVYSSAGNRSNAVASLILVWLLETDSKPLHELSLVITRLLRQG